MTDCRRARSSQVAADRASRGCTKRTTGDSRRSSGEAQSFRSERASGAFVRLGLLNLCTPRWFDKPAPGRGDASAHAIGRSRLRNIRGMPCAHATPTMREEHTMEVASRSTESRAEADKTARLGNALGWFSIGLGLAQITAPRSVARLIGLKDDG